MPELTALLYLSLLMASEGNVLTNLDWIEQISPG